MNIQPVVLEGNLVRLEPLTLAHLSPLCEVGLDEELWKLTTVLIRTPVDMKKYIATAMEDFAKGKALPFVIIAKASGQVVGSTRFGNIDTNHRRVEIGWTWVARQWQRTLINTEAKYLLLSHAFDTLGCIRVEFKTDSTNIRSRNALARIGAKEEGVMRNHMIVPGGRIRHSVYFSIVDSEWPDVKKELEMKLEKKY
jgi:N-acetyltransferase